MYGKSYDGADRPDRRRQAARRASARSSPRSRSTTTTATSTATACAARTRCATPALYDGIAATPGPVDRRPELQRQRASTTRACLALNFAAQAGNDDHDSAFWKPRNLIPGAAGSNVPLFLTQGLTENNTVADGTAAVPRTTTPATSAPGSARGSTCAATRRDETRPAEDGPRGLVRRGHALLRPVPEGRHADGRRPADRGADQRRQVARRGPVAAGRRDAATRARCEPGSYTDDGSDSAHRATDTRRASGRSPRRCRTTRTWRARARRSST